MTTRRFGVLNQLGLTVRLKIDLKGIIEITVSPEQPPLGRFLKDGEMASFIVPKDAAPDWQKDRELLNHVQVINFTAKPVAVALGRRRQDGLALVILKIDPVVLN